MAPELAAAVSAQAAKDEAPRQATAAFTKAIYCLKRNNMLSDFAWKEMPAGGEENAFLKTLERVTVSR